MFLFPALFVSVILGWYHSVFAIDISSPFIVAGIVFPAIESFRSGLGIDRRAGVDRLRGWIAFFVGNATSLGLSLLLIPQLQAMGTKFDLILLPIISVGVAVSYVFAKRVANQLVNVDNKTTMSLISSVLLQLFFVQYQQSFL